MRCGSYVVFPSSTLKRATLMILALAATTAACSDPAGNAFTSEDIEENNNLSPQYKIHDVNVAVDAPHCTQFESKLDIKLHVDFQDWQNEYASVVDYESETQAGVCQLSFQLPQATNLAGHQVLVVKVYDDGNVIARCSFYTREFGQVSSPNDVKTVICENQGTEIKVRYRGSFG